MNKLILAYLLCTFSMSVYSQRMQMLITDSNLIKLRNTPANATCDYATYAGTQCDPGLCCMKATNGTTTTNYCQTTTIAG